MKKFIYTVLSFAPAIGLAQEADLGGIERLVDSIGGIINSLLPILFALALVYFFWGLIKYIRAAGDAKAAAEGKSIMIYGVIALTVMVSIYGLIAWLQSTLGIEGNSVTIPTVPGLE
ncbi:MAG: hypothetical protein V4690_04295 [Patescibacteria group bacterium]